MAERTGSKPIQSTRGVGLLAVLFSTLVLCGCAGSKASLRTPSSAPIHHTVFFTLRADVGGESERAFFEALASLEAIPVVRGFQRVREVSPKNEFEHGLVMHFDHRDDYDRYNAHPAHLEFVETHWVPMVESFQEIDYVRRGSVRHGSVRHGS